MDVIPRAVTATMKSYFFVFGLTFGSILPVFGLRTKSR